MPSKSPAQARLMRAAAHTSGGFGGVPQSVGREFVAADKGSAKSRDEHMKRKAKHSSQKEVARDFGVHPSTVSRRMAKGFTYEGSAADEAADKRNAKKAGMTVKQWEGSPGDRKADAAGQRALDKRRGVKA